MKFALLKNVSFDPFADKLKDDPHYLFNNDNYKEYLDSKIEYYDFDEQTRPIKRFIDTKGTPNGKKDILLMRNLFLISPIISSATLICSRLIKTSYGNL